MHDRIFDFDAPLPARLYWDASFIVHATYPAGRYHQACYTFLDRLNSAPGSLSYVSTLALDEVTFTLIQLKVEEEYPDKGFWEVYRRTPNVIRPHLEELRTLIDRLFDEPRVKVVGIGPQAMSMALEQMDSYSMLPRDALHLTTMAHHSVDNIVTTDSDFLTVDKIHIYTCNPKILSHR
jgi:predicted nucleic acid-binding protein